MWLDSTIRIHLVEGGPPFSRTGISSPLGGEFANYECELRIVRELTCLVLVSPLRGDTVFSRGVTHWVSVIVIGQLFHARRHLPQNWKTQEPKLRPHDKNHSHSFFGCCDSTPQLICRHVIIPTRSRNQDQQKKRTSMTSRSSKCKWFCSPGVLISAFVSLLFLSHAGMY